MHYFEYATKDTTLYEVSKSMNTGLDEILEIRKDMSDDGSVLNVTRGLIKFDLTYISQSVVDGLISSPTYYLNLYDANSQALNISQKLYAYPVSQSWDMGSGKAQSNPIIEDGASWKFRDNKNSATTWFGSYSTLQGDNYATGSWGWSSYVASGSAANGPFEINIGGVDFTYVSSSVGYNNSSTQIFLNYYSGSDGFVGARFQNQQLVDAINNSGSLHNLPLSASIGGIGNLYTIVSGSTAGSHANTTVTTGSATPGRLPIPGFDSDNPRISGGTDTTTTFLSGGGGTWFSGSDGQYSLEASQSFTHEPSDLRMDVTGIVNNWIYSGSNYSNEGFMIKRSGSYGNEDSNVEEGNTTHYGNFIFFGRDTHTVYQPKLEVVWDDSKWITGSLSALSNTEVEDMVLYMRGFRPEYKETSKTKFRVVGRARYPEKTYVTSGYSTGYTTAKTLPSGSTYYEIKDAYTEEVIVPFGSGSVVSCDSTGNYFNFWMNGLQSERFYRINYKVVSGSGTADETVQYFDEKHSFKVVR